MIRIFQLMAVVLAGAAAYFFWGGNRDYTFVAIVLGCLAFFLSIRFEVKARNETRAAEREANESESEVSS